MAWQEQFFRLNKAKTVVLITLSVLLLAGAGVLAGVVAEQDPEPFGPQPAPLGGGPLPEENIGSGDREEPPSFGAALARGLSAAGPLSQASPSPVGSPSTPSPSPAVSPSPSPGPTGDSIIVLSGGVVTIPLPEPWTLQEVTEDGTQARVSDGRGNHIWAGVFEAGGADAARILADNRQNFTSFVYGTLQFEEEHALLNLFGSITSIDGLYFSGTALDAQGSAQMRGFMFAAVRGDGQALVMTQETTPPEHWDPATAEVYPVLQGGAMNFAGL